MSDAHLAVLPTKYQASTFPQRWQYKIAVVHEGIREDLLSKERLLQLQIDVAIRLDESVPLVTFISRNLEPMRGFPTFMQGLPELLERHKRCQVVIVGGDEVSYSTAPADGRNWKEVMKQELGKQIDWSRVHIMGRIPYEELAKLYRRSNLHVYLSNPFVLSWSLMEIMACGTPVLACDNAMMQDLITDEETGFLWKQEEGSLGRAIARALENREKLAVVGQNGKRLIMNDYRQEACLEQLESILLNMGQIF